MSEKSTCEELEQKVKELEKEVLGLRQVEKAIELSKREWESTFDAMSDWIILMDMEYRIQRSNRAGENFVSLATEEIIGRKCCYLVHGTEEPIPGCPVQKMIRTNQPETVDFYQQEMNRWLKISVDPITNKDGHLMGAIHNIRDITEHKQAEEALRESEEQLHSLLQNIQAAAVVHGPDTKIIKCNKASQELLGLTEDQMLGKKAIDPSWRFFDEDGSDMPLERYPVNRVMATKNVLKDVIAGIYRPNKNDVVSVLVNAVPIIDHDGNILQVIVTFMDITEREKLIKELQEALKEIKTLRGILPLCSFCNKIRDEKGCWEKVDVYINAHSQADISHSICPECATEHYPDLDL